MLSPFAGVPIFFVVSGYLVSASYERQEEVLSYIRNRLFRIYPGLWVCLLATLVTVLVIGYRMQHVKDFTWFPIQLFGVIFTPKFLQHFGVGSYNGALWTIPIELQFYFVLPVVYSLLGLKKRRGNKLLYAAFGIWTALTLLLYYADPTLLPKYSFSSTHHRLVETLLIHSFVPTFYMFFFGVVLHRTHIFSRKAVAGKGIIWLAVYVMFHLSLARFQGSPVFVILSNLFLGVTAISMAYTLPKLSQFLLRG
jgi:peptidoglycan/LPS O-acetylase OafA/YrhL